MSITLNLFFLDRLVNSSFLSFEFFAKMTTQTIPLEVLQQRIKERLQARGGLGIHALGRTFHNMDDNGNKLLDKYEFSKALSEMGINLNKVEFSSLVDYYDKNSIPYVYLLLMKHRGWEH